MMSIPSENCHIFRTMSGLASNFIGACFDQAKPFIDKDYSEIDPFVRFVSTQLYIDCQLTSESVLILIRESKEWDADLLSRSVMEGSLKYIYMLIGSHEEIKIKAEEYWELLPLFYCIKHSERVARLIAELPNPESLEWKPFRELLLRDDEIDAIKKRYGRVQRKELEQKWSFSGISKQFLLSESSGLRLFGHLAHGYGMSSHLLHKDADGVGMVWERTIRDPLRQSAVRSGHVARIVSDICTFSKLRLFYLLKLCNADTECIRQLEDTYAFLFDELKMANTLFSQTEYDIKGNKVHNNFE